MYLMRVGERAAMKSYALVFLLMNFLLVNFTIHAGDGQIDILPNGAETFTISKRGSYILTDDVTMTADVDCIKITANEVTLDLNGHTIMGMAGSTNSLGINGVNAGKVTIRNGRIVGFGRYGILLNILGNVENVTVTSCGGKGISISTYGHVISCTAYHNKLFGIEAGYNSIVERCVSNSNGGGGHSAGIFVGDNSVVKDCVASNNRSDTTDQDINVYGIQAGNGCTIINNTCNNNTNNTTFNGGSVYGIGAKSSCTIKDNTCTMNSASNQGTNAYGIKALDSCVITGNSCSENSSSGASGDCIGIWIDGQCLVADNTCALNKATGSDTDAYGIYAFGADNIIRGNNCSKNEAKLTAAGIYVGGSSCRIDNNLCTHNSGATINYAILLKSGIQGCYIVRNITNGNSSGGINLKSGEHYCGANVHYGPSPFLEFSNAEFGDYGMKNVSY